MHSSGKVPDCSERAAWCNHTICHLLFSTFSNFDPATKASVSFDRAHINFPNFHVFLSTVVNVATSPHSNSKSVGASKITTFIGKSYSLSMARTATANRGLVDQVVELAPRGRKIKGMGHALRRLLNVEIDYPFWEHGDPEDRKLRCEYERMLDLPGLSELDTAFYLFGPGASGTTKEWEDYDDLRLKNFKFSPGPISPCKRDACKLLGGCARDQEAIAPSIPRLGRYDGFFLHQSVLAIDGHPDDDAFPTGPDYWMLPRAGSWQDDTPCPQLLFVRLDRHRYLEQVNEHGDEWYEDSDETCGTCGRNFFALEAGGSLGLNLRLLDFQISAVSRSLWLDMFHSVYLYRRWLSAVEVQNTEIVAGWLGRYLPFSDSFRNLDDGFLRQRIGKVLNLVIQRPDAHYSTERQRLVLHLLQNLFLAFEEWWSTRKLVDEEMSTLVRQGRVHGAGQAALRYILTNKCRDDIYRIKFFTDNLLFIIIARAPSVDERILRYLQDDSVKGWGFEGPVGGTLSCSGGDV
ncbi:hypothetical protein BJ508DRAFT_160682 [Ascobolus immersus RN42]|uniref:Uncharacterized protein n=1 Tax=Ascobolus immersus RN42 TaxID=1160509 RepID=A0A3N4I0B6_ASCIM|nr:hypothetical protein BJ508DRAFT_160682 [Ascobolus immersus RN42]